MPQRWAIACVAVTFLCVGALVGALLAPRTVEAAKNPEKVAPTRIAYVNIAKVMRDSKVAKLNEQALAQKRQECKDKIKPLREKIANDQRWLSEGGPEQREKILTECKALQRELEDYEQHAQRELIELTDRTFIVIHERMHATVAELAKERGLDVVEIYPDAVNQAKLEPSALMPFYLREELDITDVIIERLNKKYPLDD